MKVITLKRHLKGMGWRYNGRMDGGWGSQYWTFVNPSFPKLRLSWDCGEPALGWCIEGDWCLGCESWDDPYWNSGVAIGETMRHLAEWMQYYRGTKQVQWSST